MKRILRLVIFATSIAAIGGWGLWLTRPNAASTSGSRLEVGQRGAASMLAGKIVRKLTRPARTGSSSASLTKSEASAQLSAIANDIERLTEEQRGRVRPSLEALEQMEEVAVDDGDQELIEKINTERQRVLRAVAGLDVQPVAAR